MKEDKRNRGFPNLDKYLKDRGRKLVNYEEGAEIYGIPYYSFVRLAKEAEATFTLRKTAVADIDVIEKYLDEHPRMTVRVHSMIWLSARILKASFGSIMKKTGCIC